MWLQRFEPQEQGAAANDHHRPADLELQSLPPPSSPIRYAKLFEKGRHASRTRVPATPRRVELQETEFGGPAHRAKVRLDE